MHVPSGKIKIGSSPISLFTWSIIAWLTADLSFSSPRSNQILLMNMLIVFWNHPIRPGCCCPIIEKVRSLIITKISSTVVWFATQIPPFFGWFRGLWKLMMVPKALFISLEMNKLRLVFMTRSDGMIPNLSRFAQTNIEKSATTVKNSRIGTKNTYRKIKPIA